MTLERIGESMGTTKEWVRQIEAKAMRKLREYYNVAAFCGNEKIYGKSSV